MEIHNIDTLMYGGERRNAITITATKQTKPSDRNKAKYKRIKKFS